MLGALVPFGWCVLSNAKVRSIVEQPWDFARLLVPFFVAHRAPSAPSVMPSVVMVERQPIRPVAEGRSFASSTGAAPWHTDSQLFAGSPPHLQVIGCVRPASRGGATRLVDSREILACVEREDPALYAELFRTRRTARFVFGDVEATTVSLAGGSVVFTHPPRAEDPIGLSLAPYVPRATMTELSLSAGDLLVVDNHRMLHGRTAFEDPERELQRLLIWLDRPITSDPELVARAAVGTPPARLADREVEADPRDPALLAIVDEMVRGEPPGVLAARHGIPEAHLYVLRDRAFAAGLVRTP